MQKEDNRSVGGRFEQELGEILSSRGFWVHLMQQNKAGQPADMIAVKGKFHTLIDCKVCENGFFAFERIEDNQRSAMKLFFRKGGELSYFALKMPDGKIRMVSLERCETLRGRGKKRIADKDIETETWDLDAWLDSSDIWAEDI